MPRDFPSQVMDRLRKCRVVAAFSVERPSHAVPLARALLAGGVDAIELTLRTPAALDGIAAICQDVPEMLVGVGTILTPDQLQSVKSAGAAFGLAPGLNRRVLEAAQQEDFPFVPGICTPSDLELAIEYGCRFVKFFPAQPSGGTTYLKSLSAPYAHLGIQYFPLGGVNSENMVEYLELPQVCCVGGTWIVKKDIVEQEDWAEITSRAAEVRSSIK